MKNQMDVGGKRKSELVRNITHVLDYPKGPIKPSNKLLIRVFCKRTLSIRPQLQKHYVAFIKFFKVPLEVGLAPYLLLGT